MADWPKHHLERATKVTIEAEGHTWEMDGATFVRCLASGGWTYRDPDYACPKCGNPRYLEVSVQVYRRLIQKDDGNIQTGDSRYDSSEDWDDDSAACCVACQWTGFVSALRQPASSRAKSERRSESEK